MKVLGLLLPSPSRPLSSQLPAQPSLAESICPRLDSVSHASLCQDREARELGAPSLLRAPAGVPGEAPMSSSHHSSPCLPWHTGPLPLSVYNRFKRGAVPGQTVALVAPALQLLCPLCLAPRPQPTCGGI